MMGIRGFKTKKDLKAGIGREPRFIETSLFGPKYQGDGSYVVVGPDPYNNRRWYATVKVENGKIAKVS